MADTTTGKIKAKLKSGKALEIFAIIIFAAVGNWYMTLRRDRKARGQSAADGAAGNAAGSAAVNGQAENAENAAAHAPPEEGEPPEGSFEGNESGKR